MTDLVDNLTELHIKVLKQLLEGKSFSEIQNNFADEMAATNYLEIMIDRAHRLTFNYENELIGAYPVCPLPTDHQVEVEEIGEGYAMCAIDALGMAYTFNAKTKITSKFANNDEELNLVINPEEDAIPDTEVVVTYQKLGYDNLQEMVAANAQLAVDACPMINFYQSSEKVPKDAELEVLNIEEAVKEAKVIFSPEGIASHIQSSM